MRKVLTFLGASLVIAWALPVRAQQAPDQFKDVPTDHWAYQAVEDLRAKNIVIGYPDGYFRGKRTLTRYEFAVALDRALKSIPEPRVGPAGPQGETGPAGPAGPQGEVGPPGVTPEELANFRKLAEEFRNELASLGNTVAGINRKLDALAKQVADLDAIVRNMPKVFGGAFLGIRSDRANGLYVDRDGSVLTAIGGGTLPIGTGGSALQTRLGSIGSVPLANFRNSPAVVHDFNLGVIANIPGGATLTGVLTSNNYKNYLGGDTAVAVPARFVDPNADTYVNRLEINTPFSGLGRGSKLTFGRFGHNVSRLTLWKPEVDSYFDDPFVNDGMIVMDGARLTTNFGSVSADVFGGKTGSVTGTNGPAGVGWSAPIAGAVVPASFVNGAVGFVGAPNVPGKPIAQTNQGQMLVDELAGVSLGLGVRQLEGGHIRFTAIGAASKSGTPSGLPDPATGRTASNVLVLGADGKFTLANRILVEAEWSRSITGDSRFKTITPRDDNAFNATLGYASGSLNLSAGYRYIDPLFYAPGYWGRIGNWVNPTNIQGPVVRAAYDLTPAFGLNVGGDFFTAAKNRGSFGGLTSKDDINRILVGLKWDISKSLRTTADWEGVYYKFGAPTGGVGILGNTGNVHPTEHYVTLGAGYNLTSNTILKLAYQIGSYDGHGALLSGGLNRYNFNVFTSQVAVKF